MVALAIVATTRRERAATTAAFWRLETGFHAQQFTSIGPARAWLLLEFSRRENTN
jgi:hypothetical protein